MALPIASPLAHLPSHLNSSAPTEQFHLGSSMAQPSLLWALQKPVHIPSAAHRLFSFLLPIPHWLPVQVAGWRHSLVHSAPQLSGLSFLLRLDTQVLRCNAPVSTVPTCPVQYSRAVCSMLSEGQTTLQQAGNVAYGMCCREALGECTQGLLLSTPKIYKKGMC